MTYTGMLYTGQYLIYSTIIYLYKVFRTLCSIRRTMYGVCYTVYTLPRTLYGVQYVIIIVYNCIDRNLLSEHCLAYSGQSPLDMAHGQSMI